MNDQKIREILSAYVEEGNAAAQRRENGRCRSCIFSKI